MAGKKKIIVLIASVREGRKSDRVGLFFSNFMKNKTSLDPEIVDLRELQFPIFSERLKFMKEPDKKVLWFAEKIRTADGIVIVTPEYNGGYPASLKNVIDLLYDEWKGKPVAVSTVSGGPFGGSQAITSLTFSLWKIGATVVPAMFPVPHVEEAFDENGKPADEAGFERRATAFVNGILRLMPGEA